MFKKAKYKKAPYREWRWQAEHHVSPRQLEQRSLGGYPTHSSPASAAVLPVPAQSCLSQGTRAVCLRVPCSSGPRRVLGAAQGHSGMYPPVCLHAALPCASCRDNVIRPRSFGHICLHFWALATAAWWWGGLQASLCVFITAPCPAQDPCACSLASCCQSGCWDLNLIS